MPIVHKGLRKAENKGTKTETKFFRTNPDGGLSLYHYLELKKKKNANCIVVGTMALQILAC